MSSFSAKASSPLTFDLQEDLLAKVEALRARQHAASNSEVIRFAIASFNYRAFQPERRRHRQISVRLPREKRSELLRLARTKRVSVGELLRVALAALPTSPIGLGTKTKNAVIDPMKKGTKKKSAKKKKK